MLRKSHIVVLALVAAAVAAPIAQADKPADPLALSILRQKGYTPAQIAAMTKVSSPGKRPVDPLAASILRQKGYSASQIATMTGGSIPLTAVTRPIDPLALSYLRGLGLTPSEIADWTTGVCSKQDKPASCFAVFDRNNTVVETTSTGFAWGDAGIGAAATLGLVLLAVGLGFTMVTRGRGRRAGQPEHV